MRLSLAQHHKQFLRDVTEALRDLNIGIYGNKLDIENLEGTIEVSRGSTRVSISITSEDGLAINLNVDKDRKFAHEERIPSDTEINDLCDLIFAAL